MIILASKSASRRAMLDNAGIAYRAMPAELDERAIEAAMAGAAPAQIAEALAQAKALSVSASYLEDIVLGSDSLVEVEGVRFDKPQSREEAAEHLRFFSGKQMRLHASASLARGNTIIFQENALAELHIRQLSKEFIQSYLAQEWPDVGHCAGVFRIEALGVHLFERIAGDYFVILGMPLLPVLNALRALGVEGILGGMQENGSTQVDGGSA